MTNDSNKFGPPNDEGPEAAGSQSDETDEVVARRMSVFNQVDVPGANETWAQITSPAAHRPATASATLTNSPRRWMPAIAAGLVLIGLGIAAVAVANNDSTPDQGVTGVETESNQETESQTDAGPTEVDEGEAGDADSFVLESTFGFTVTLPVSMRQDTSPEADNWRESFVNDAGEEFRSRAFDRPNRSPFVDDGLEDLPSFQDGVNEFVALHADEFGTDPVLTEVMTDGVEGWRIQPSSDATDPELHTMVLNGRQAIGGLFLYVELRFSRSIDPQVQDTLQFVPAALAGQAAGLKNAGPLDGLWRLVGVTREGNQIPVPTEVDGGEPTIEIDGSQLSAFTGCNRSSLLAVRYNATGDKIEVDSGGWTQRECGNPDLEEAFVEALRLATTYETSGTTLIIRSAGTPSSTLEFELSVGLFACTTLRGGEPWVTLFEPEPGRPCLIVGDFQRPQIWNKGSESTTVDWVDGPRTLESDSFFATGPAPIGDLVDVGPNRFVSSPYRMPIIVLKGRDDSFSAGVTDFNPPESFANVTTGMTLIEASRALGVAIVSQMDVVPGPKIHAAFVEGDPYSPIFVVVGDGGPTSVIGSINPNDTDLSTLESTIECGGLEAIACPMESDIELVELLLGGGELPVHPEATVSLGKGGSADITQLYAMADGASPWVFDMESFLGYEGTFDFGDRLNELDPELRGEQFEVSMGEHQHCASPPLPAPEMPRSDGAVLAGNNIRQISIQPLFFVNCLAWFAIDLFVDGDGLIQAIRWEIWEP